jgi:hypothetical protein
MNPARPSPPAIGIGVQVLVSLLVYHYLWLLRIPLPGGPSSGEYFGLWAAALALPPFWVGLKISSDPFSAGVKVSLVGAVIASGLMILEEQIIRLVGGSLSEEIAWMGLPAITGAFLCPLGGAWAVLGRRLRRQNLPGKRHQEE